MFKPADILNFSSSPVQACFSLKIYLREKGSLTDLLLYNKWAPNLVTYNNNCYLPTVDGSALWVRFRDPALELVSAALIRGSTVSRWSATSLICLVVAWLLAAAPWYIFLILQPAGPGSFTGFLRPTRESKPQMYKCFNHLPDLGKASHSVNPDWGCGERYSTFGWEDE